MPRVIINTTFDEAVESEKLLIALHSIPKWIEGQQPPAAGELITYLGNIYRATGKQSEEMNPNVSPAFNGVSYAMHPVSSIKTINQMCLMENVQIELRSGQVWVYLPVKKMVYDNHIVIGTSSYYNHSIHDICGLGFKIAFNGLLTHQKNNLLSEVL